ncbi:hypothetical protein AB1Y20_014472 [Prymnesium parvum]|uniref:Uncharacterized protein n=1 Tax=Prymnesium parvum TaxID=97485 RepID=A0AB34IF26_PRYPA
MLRTVRQLHTVAGLGSSMYHSLKLTHTGGQVLAAVSLRRRVLLLLAAAPRADGTPSSPSSPATAVLPHGGSRCGAATCSPKPTPEAASTLVLALQGLFALMLKHNLELPRHYGRKCDIVRQERGQPSVWSREA